MTRIPQSDPPLSKHFIEFGTAVFTGGLSFLLKIYDRIGEIQNVGMRFCGLMIIGACGLTHGSTSLWSVGIILVALMGAAPMESPFWLFWLAGATCVLLVLGAVAGYAHSWRSAADSDPSGGLPGPQDTSDQVRAQLKRSAQLLKARDRVDKLQVSAKQIECDLAGGKVADAQASLANMGKDLSQLKSLHTRMGSGSDNEAFRVSIRG